MPGGHDPWVIDVVEKIDRIEFLNSTSKAAKTGHKLESYLIMQKVLGYIVQVQKPLISPERERKTLGKLLLPAATYWWWLTETLRPASDKCIRRLPFFAFHRISIFVSKANMDFNAPNANTKKPPWPWIMRLCKMQWRLVRKWLAGSRRN